MIELEIEFEPPEKFQKIDFKGGNHEQFEKTETERSASLRLDLIIQEEKIFLKEKRCPRLYEIFPYD